MPSNYWPFKLSGIFPLSLWGEEIWGWFIMCAMGEYLGLGNLLLFGETNKKLDKKDYILNNGVYELGIWVFNFYGHCCVSVIDDIFSILGFQNAIINLFLHCYFCYLSYNTIFLVRRL